MERAVWVALRKLRERQVINAGRAYSRGVEGEFTTLLPLDLTWTLSGAYLDAAIGQDQSNPAGGGVIPKGTRLENVPRFAGNAALSHDFRLQREPASG